MARLRGRNELSSARKPAGLVHRRVGGQPRVTRPRLAVDAAHHAGRDALHALAVQPAAGGDPQRGLVVGVDAGLDPQAEAALLGRGRRPVRDAHARSRAAAAVAGVQDPAQLADAVVRRTSTCRRPRRRPRRSSPSCSAAYAAHAAGERGLRGSAWPRAEPVRDGRRAPRARRRRRRRATAAASPCRRSASAVDRRLAGARRSSRAPAEPQRGQGRQGHDCRVGLPVRRRPRSAVTLPRLPRPPPP